MSASTTLPACADCGTVIGERCRDDQGDYVCMKCRGKRQPPLDAITAAEQLTEILGLSAHGLKVTGGRVVGRGSRASADIYLSDGEAITFETLRDVATHRTLTIEVASCTPAAPTITAALALRALSLLRLLAEHHDAGTDDDLAAEWGVGYLQNALPVTVDMGDQAARWASFCELGKAGGPEASSPWLAGPMLVHEDGTRFVRADWFRQYVRQHDPGVSIRDIPGRMLRVGWQRRGSEGRIKATRPDLPGSLQWAFLIAPAGWEDER